MKEHTRHLTQWTTTALLLITTQLIASAATNYVWQGSPSPTPPYTNWATAATNIQDAVDAACAGDTVLVTNGVYASGGRVVDGAANRVAVEKPLHIQSVNGPDVTIIEARKRAVGGGWPGAIRCVHLAEGATLTGFTLTKGVESLGGGVLCESTNAWVSNCVLTGNSASAGGGAYSGTLNNCTLTDNRAWYGGGAYRSTLNNCTLTDNWSINYGGGAANCILNNCELVGNLAEWDGGGAIDSTLNNCVVRSNSAGNLMGGRGGGVFTSQLTNSILIGNDAYREGGGAYQSTLTSCRLIGNSAVFGGGALVSRLQNCVIAGNSAREALGGALGRLVNCTVVGNSASERVGGAAGWLTNCIVYFNSAPVQANYWSDHEINYTCTYPMPTNGVGNITNAPLFVDTNNWADLRLRPDSPCIDAGNNDFVTWDTDLDGNPRIHDGTVDMGAYEFVPLTPAELVQQLIDAVTDSDLPHKRPLLASLEAALASIERGNHNSTTGQLGAFQNKVGAQVDDPVCAMELIEGAQRVIDELDDSPRLAGRIHSLKRQNGKMQMKIKGEAGKSYILEASTNLVDWEAVGVATVNEDGSFEFEDPETAKHPSRFYRLAVPK